MYCNFFGLSCLPFEDRADVQFSYATVGRERVIEALRRRAMYKKGIVLVEGEAGIGKTLAIRELLRRLQPLDRTIVLTWQKDSSMDLTREVCKGRPRKCRPITSKIANCACACCDTACISRKRRSNGLFSKIAVAPAAR